MTHVEIAGTAGNLQKMSFLSYKKARFRRFGLDKDPTGTYSSSIISVIITLLMET